MRIAIANHLTDAIAALREALAAGGDFEIAWIARDGAEAVAKCRQDRPDLVLMELELPVVDGVEATRQIMAEAKCPILVVTTTVEGSASQVFDAMGFGALDAVNTPQLGAPGASEGLLRKIASIRRLVGNAAAPRPAAEEARLPPLIAVGSSTGGPAALSGLLAALPGDLPAAIVVVQHVDALFAPGMAEWLDSQTPLAVGMAESGGAPRAGTVHLAGTDDHLVITAVHRYAYTPEPVELPYRPSVDVFFESLAVHWPVPSAAVVLTGMGRDGAQGLLALRRLGWLTVAQDEESSLIYGMPKACAEIGAARSILPLTEIPAEIERAARRLEREARR